MSINRPNVFSPSSSSTPDFFFDVARGAYGGFFQTLNISGYSTAVNTTEKVVAYQSALNVNASQNYVTIESDSTADTLGGTGAQRVTIKGVDRYGEYAEEVVQMNGTTAVSLANAYIFVNECSVAQAGRGYTNAGKLVIKNTPGSDEVVMEAGIGRTQIGAFLVPKQYRMVLMSSAITAARADNKCNLEISLRKYSNVFAAPFNYMVFRGVTSIDNSNTDGSFFQSEFPLLFNPGEMVYYTAKSSAASNSIVGIQGYGILMADS